MWTKPYACCRWYRLLSLSPSFLSQVIDEGRVFAFGSNSDGQLGLGDRAEHSGPVLVKALEGIRIRQVASGKGFSLFLSGFIVVHLL
jgi:alpha-tubulin suppressor-like RCC1 family protein